MWLAFLCILVLFVTIPIIILLYQTNYKPNTSIPKIEHCNTHAPHDETPAVVDATTIPEPNVPPPNTHAKDAKEQEPINVFYQEVESMRSPYVGTTSKRELSSDIISRIGYKGIQPKLEARYKFMEGVLPKTKRSKYMIPIPDPM